MKNSKSTQKSKPIFKKPAFIVAVIAAILALILAFSYQVSKANRVEITQLVLNGTVELNVGEAQAVGFNVATAKVQDNDLVIAAVNKLDLVWTTADESVAVYDEQAGVLRGVSAGTTTLTLSTKDGALSDTCQIIVMQSSEAATAETAAE